MRLKPLDVLQDFKRKKQHQQTCLHVFVSLALMRYDIFFQVRKYKGCWGKPWLVMWLQVEKNYRVCFMHSTCTGVYIWSLACSRQFSGQMNDPVSWEAVLALTRASHQHKNEAVRSTVAKPCSSSGGGGGELPESSFLAFATSVLQREGLAWKSPQICLLLD